MVTAMIRTRTILYCLASLLFLADASQAADSKGLYQTLYYIPCSSYVQDRKEPENSGHNAVDKIYVSGWLSGYNYLTPNTFDILPDHNIDGVMKWLDAYCAKKPAGSLEAGLLQLTDELYPNRVQNNPAVPTVPSGPATAEKKPAETPFDDIHFHIQDK